MRGREPVIGDLARVLIDGEQNCQEDTWESTALVYWSMKIALGRGFTVKVEELRMLNTYKVVDNNIGTKSVGTIATQVALEANSFKKPISLIVIVYKTIPVQLTQE